MTHLHRKIDSVGVCLSLLCAVHCAALPILILFLPAYDYLFTGTNELIFVIFTLSLATFSVVLGALSHRKAKPFYFLFFSFVMIGIAEQLEENNAYHRIFFMIGAIMLMITHLVNRRLCNATDSLSGNSLVTKIGKA